MQGNRKKRLNTGNKKIKTPVKKKVNINKKKEGEGDKKPRKPFWRDEQGKLKTKELLQSGAALAALAGGTAHASQFASSSNAFDEQNTDDAAGKGKKDLDKIDLF